MVISTVWLEKATKRWMNQTRLVSKSYAKSSSSTNILAHHPTHSRKHNPSSGHYTINSRFHWLVGSKFLWNQVIFFHLFFNGSFLKSSVTSFSLKTSSCQPPTPAGQSLGGLSLGMGRLQSMGSQRIGHNWAHNGWIVSLDFNYFICQIYLYPLIHPNTYMKINELIQYFTLFHFLLLFSFLISAL